MNVPLVTAIVSTYNSERFFRGCLDDLVAQTLFPQMEVLVIDSGSPQNESEICLQYVRQYPQIKLVRTQREPLYAAWNRAIAMARGKYLTNANTDDRHRCDFMELMAQTLDTHPDVALVYSEQLISETENETYDACIQRNAKPLRLPDYAPRELMERCITGSQPMWRKALHETLGGFDTRYRIAADYDMWLRIANHHRLLKHPERLGVFYMSAQTLSGADNQAAMNLEILDVQRKYMKQAPWRDIPGMRQKIAAEWFGRGYQRIQKDRNNRAAQPFIREAIKLDPFNLSFLKTYVLRCMLNLQ